MDLNDILKGAPAFEEPVLTAAQIKEKVILQNIRMGKQMHVVLMPPMDIKTIANELGRINMLMELYEELTDHKLTNDEVADLTKEYRKANPDAYK